MAEELETAAQRAAATLAAGRGTAGDCTTLGWYRAVMGDHAAAADLFERALALNPHEVEAMVALAGLHRTAGRLRDAALRCDQAIALAPGHADAWLERAYVMAAGGVMDEARRCYGEVVSRAPGHGAAHAGLAGLAAGGDRLVEEVL